MLWDSNDNNNGEYNGSQDLVFITEINQGIAGMYGVYDYEIKIPAELRDYVEGGVEKTVTFYVELI